jgi:hypothetical protein
VADTKAAIDAAQNLLELDGVTGVGLGEQNGEACILVFVTRPKSEMEGRVPRAISGVPVVLRETDPFVAG